MASRKPLVMVNGIPAQLPAGDTLNATASEVDVLGLTNGGASAAPICSPVYISAANTFQLARANASGTYRAVALIRDASIAAAASGSCQSDGVLTASTAQWDAVTGQTGGLTTGAQYFLSSTTAGRLTTTAPTTTGEYVLPMGTALSTTDFEISISPFGILL